MKKSSFTIGLALVIAMLTLPGCLDIWITTQIRPDGSLSQSIAFQGDSAEIADVRFGCMRENGWKKEWTKPEKDKYKLVLTRDFRSVKDLNTSMNPADTSQSLIRTQSTLQRKFRWFFTRFEYEQKALKANPYPWINYHDYLTSEDVRLISLSDDGRKSDPAYDSIAYKITEKKFEDYVYRSMYEDLYRTLVSILREDHSLTLTPDVLSTKKETMYHYLIDSLNGDSSEEILRGIGHVINHPDIETIRGKYINRFDGFQERMNFYQSCSDDNYKFAIRMPGLLLQSNSQKIEGAQAGWDLPYYRFFFEDFTMSAESRVINTWAFVVAGIILLIAAAGLIAGIRRKLTGKK